MELLSIDDLAKKIEPKNTVLFFGSGSSIPSGAPSVQELIEHIERRFDLSNSGLTLRELATHIDGVGQRRKLIDLIRETLVDKMPTRGLSALPAYQWKSIYTTNYDELIELAYSKAGVPVNMYCSDFDFSKSIDKAITPLFKIHGTVSQDYSTGHQSRMIVSDIDYDNTSQFRDKMYRIFEGDLVRSDLVIVGHSLADLHIKDIVERVTKAHNASGGAFRVFFLAYNRDDIRANLLVRRGISVSNGSIDELFAAIAKIDREGPTDLFADLLPTSLGAKLSPSTTDVAHDLLHGRGGFEKMFNGRPATYRDIALDRTFQRDAVARVLEQLERPAQRIACVLGASGVGKTTLCRQVMRDLIKAGVASFEHQNDHELMVDSWVRYARGLPDDQRVVLFVDDVHHHLHSVNELLDRLVDAGVENFQILVACAKNMWSPRIKSPNIYKVGKEHYISRLSRNEIDALLRLVETSEEVRMLVEPVFAGFSTNERRRRLEQRCDADMFVCLRNIFASIKFDDIILKEYGELDRDTQDVYRIVSALEAFGVRVHRQLILRITGISADVVASVLARLDDIILEYDVYPKQGIYGWKGRHKEISGIVKKYKYDDEKELFNLMKNFISNIVPTVEMELNSIREICHSEGGIKTIPSQSIQNLLYRKIITELPGERVPRHRLIQNLIRAGEYDPASAEIRIYEKDFRGDGAITRYKVQLDVHRAENSPGLAREDRLAIARGAFDAALEGTRRFPSNKYMFFSLGRAARVCFKYGGEFEYLDAAINQLKDAEERLFDPEVEKFRRQLENVAAPLELDD